MDNIEDRETGQVSISSMFYTRIFRTKKITKPKRKLKKILLYEKNTRKMLMKLTAGVNLTNILWAAFVAILLLLKKHQPKGQKNHGSIFCIMFKMLVSLTPGLNYTNILGGFESYPDTIW